MLCTFCHLLSSWKNYRIFNINCNFSKNKITISLQYKKWILPFLVSMTFYKLTASDMKSFKMEFGKKIARHFFFCAISYTFNISLNYLTFLFSFLSDFLKKKILLLKEKQTKNGHEGTHTHQTRRRCSKC